MYEQRHQIQGPYKTHLFLLSQGQGHATFEKCPQSPMAVTEATVHKAY